MEPQAFYRSGCILIQKYFHAVMLYPDCLHAHLKVIIIGLYYPVNFYLASPTKMIYHAAIKIH